MAAIDKALEFLKTSGSINYAATAKKFECDEITLRRRHQGKQRARRDADSLYKSRLSKQQEQDLVTYIRKLSLRGIPPTLSMIRNFAQDIAKIEVGKKNWPYSFVQPVLDSHACCFILFHMKLKQSLDPVSKRAKGRTNKSTWNEARGPYEERGEKARDTSYHEIWYCKHCDSTKKPNSITTNLSRARKHLRDFHGIRVIEHVERSDLKKQQHGTITDLFGRQEERQAHRDLNAEKYLANAINIPAFEEALARLLAVRNIAHTFIEYPEFHAVILSCNYMARDVLLRSRRAVPKLLKKTFAQHKQGLFKKLHNSLSSMVHFTIDMWTSSEQKAAYQAIVVHFVDAETRGVAQALLSLREFKGSHNGKLQAKAFLEVVEEYDLRGKVGYFTMDNHDANDTMLGDIAKEIDGLDPVARRLRCSGHIMNLIVQAFLFRSKAKKIQEDERERIDEAHERLCRLSEKEEGGIITKAQATEEWREFSVVVGLRRDAECS
ncbi:hypothetical protein FOFC_07949 [Fusarium oxysporum]|nr:hypothetical protein FOFC_07949 [Fusarium oxysporum]